jgi:hypothetical protein
MRKALGLGGTRIGSLFVSALWLVLAFPAFAQSPDACSAENKKLPYGRFEQAVKVELLDGGRLVKLLEPVRYVDPCGIYWDAPAGAVVDGASIPRVAWTVIGGPFEGRYRDASVIHDVFCESKSRAWKVVHETFYYAMLARGTPRWQAKVMYAAVYHFGPRWADPLTKLPPPNRQLREEDFDALQRSIRRREAAIGAVSLPPISLGEIETWTPEADSRPR